MKIILAPDSFKGSLTQEEVTEILREAVYRHFPDAEVSALPLGDGGEGTLDILMKKLGGELVSRTVQGPSGRRVEAVYGIPAPGTAVIEMARASGLTLLARDERNPLKTSTFGTGELIKDALERGCRRIFLTIGGSATNDGGIGLASALGIRFLGAKGKDVPANGTGIRDVVSVDLSGMLPAVREAEFNILCDVDNPLLGENGASAIYGPQKGATPEMIRLLDAGLKNYADALTQACGKDFRDLPGSGAAGGISLPLLSFANARLLSGTEAVLELTGFPEMLEDTDLVITGEGRLDGQSIRGKVLSGVGKACKKAGVPCIAVCGARGDQAERIHDVGVDAVLFTVDRIMTAEEIGPRAKETLANAAEELMRLLQVGGKVMAGR